MKIMVSSKRVHFDRLSVRGASLQSDTSTSSVSGELRFNRTLRQAQCPGSFASIGHFDRLSVRGASLQSDTSTGSVSGELRFNRTLRQAQCQGETKIADCGSVKYNPSRTN